MDRAQPRHRTFFLFEHGQRGHLQQLLPVEAQGSFKVLDDKNNKFSVAQATCRCRCRTRLPWIVLGGDRQPRPAAGRFVDHFVERGGVLPAPGSTEHALLDAICASGEFLPDLLGRDVSALSALASDPFLRAPKPAPLIKGAVDEETAGATDFADFKRRLRIARRREMLRMGVRELGWGTTAEVSGELSAFADACLDASVRFCEGELRRELGTPVSEEAGGPAPRFVVMGMGKLGGEELNFSSDVDVCYFYSTDAGRVEGGEGGAEVSLHRYYSELSRRITAALEELTAEGTVFRVDLRLRPESRSGPLCNSLAAAESYYETFGRTWERQAWLRARPCAGDLALGEELLAMLEPFVYPRNAGPGLLDDVRALRAQFRDPADTGGGLGGAEKGFDVKLGGGGIRDVELVVQTLQLLNGGKRRDIRDRNTPRALPRLVVAGLLTDREARTLADAYRFWRELEHRVMIVAGAQTHRLPGDDDERASLSAGLGWYALTDFDAAIARVRRSVEEIAAPFAAGSEGPLEEATRLMSPLLERATLERLLGEHGFGELRGRGRRPRRRARPHAGVLRGGGAVVARSRSRAPALPRHRAQCLGGAAGAPRHLAPALAGAGRALRDERAPPDPPCATRRCGSR